MEYLPNMPLRCHLAVVGFSGQEVLAFFPNFKMGLVDPKKSDMNHSLDFGYQ